VPQVPAFISQNKMKQLHWDKLPPTKVQNTIWKKKDLDLDLYKKSIDFTQFEELFGAKLEKAAPAAAASQKEEKKKVELITVLDSKRGYNCGMTLNLGKSPRLKPTPSFFLSHSQLSCWA